MAATDPRLLLLAAEDNCLVACAPLKAGEPLLVEGLAVTPARDVGTGHKLARRPIAAGDKVLRYGAIIGSATAAIAQGEHIHTHNLQSDYLPTYTLEDGRSFVRDSH